jgi:putative oxidoreductase
MLPTPAQTTPYAALGLRLGLGALLLAHGLLLKVMTFGLVGTMGFFGSVGYPPALGAAVAIGETLAGIALLLGFRVRLASLAMVPVLLGATQFHAAKGWLFSAPGGGWEFPAFFALALLVQAGLGAGAFALDNLARRAPTARVAHA